ncbi:Hypothetical protein PHPALM_6201 [Phytophthora palmivora]|uniref:Uncharacterized protein n=1 Tax=Phytophthora palmivora TaxID=4796 RepID=A0A2P4YFT1_9STRA|nr:Hypothetical protein PHPALM_6201 [Phytophthora palmivora]
MAKGSPHGGISAAGFADSADSAIAMTMDATADGSRSVQFEEEDAQGYASDEEKEDEEYEEKAELRYVKTTAELLSEVGELSLQVDRMGVLRPVERTWLLSSVKMRTTKINVPLKGNVRPLFRERHEMRIRRLGGEMMRDSEWMKLFAPVPLAQARWPSLGPLLAGPMEGSGIAEVAETTILLLKAMSFRVISRPSPWILSDWNLDLASMELLRWRGKLRKAFAVQIKPRLLTASDGGPQLGGAGYQLGGTESQLGKVPGKTPYLKDPNGGQP